MLALSMLTMIFRLIMLGLLLNDAIMKLIKFLEAALQAAAVLLIPILYHAICVIMRKIETRDA